MKHTTNGAKMNQLVKITEFADFETKMAEFSNRYDAVVYDLDIPQQNRQARSDRLAIGKVIAALDRTHKEIKAPLKERVDLIDGERKRIKDRLLATQQGIKSQIEAHEAKKRAIEEAIQRRIDAIMGLAASDVDLTAADIQSRIARAEEVDPESTEYGDRQADAALAQRQILRTLRTMLDAREKYEAEQAELARLRAEEEKRIREEREARIRKEAAEKAKKQAEEEARHQAEAAAERERALKAKQEAAEREAAEAKERAKQQKEAAARREKELKDKAARDKAEAERRAQEAAKAAAERAAKEERERADRRRAEETAKAKAAKEEAERKAANKAHRARIDGEVRDDLLDLNNGNAITADQVLKAISAGKIRHVTVNY